MVREVCINVIFRFTRHVCRKYAGVQIETKYCGKSLWHAETPSNTSQHIHCLMVGKRYKSVMTLTSVKKLMAMERREPILMQHIFTQILILKCSREAVAVISCFPQNGNIMMVIPMFLECLVGNCRLWSTRLHRFFARKSWMDSRPSSPGRRNPW